MLEDIVCLLKTLQITIIRMTDTVFISASTMVNILLGLDTKTTWLMLGKDCD